MIRMYEILILLVCISFIFYHNFFSDGGQLISENIEYDSIKELRDKPQCYDPENEHPCLCVWSVETKMSCDDLNDNLNQDIINIDLFNSDRKSEDIHFHELIYSGFSEYYYSKLMEISQITYMDYIHTDGDYSRNTPQFLFFMAIEFLKRKDYQKSKEYLNRFLEVPNKYNENKYIKDKAYFRYGGCCENDITWLTDKNHKSYKIAKILKKILSSLETNIVDEKEVLGQFQALTNFDEKSDTIDLIDNIIFSIIFSMDNPPISLVEYRDNLLDKSQFILLDNFNEIFKGTLSDYYLSSQIDILIFLKLKIAKRKLHSLRDNHFLNSLYDIEALMRYTMLQSFYVKNNEGIDKISEMIDNEYNNIVKQYNKIKEKNIQFNDSKLDNPFEEFLDNPTDNLDDNTIIENDDEYKRRLNELNKYINKDRAKMIKNSWHVLINSDNNLNILNSDIDQLDYPMFLNLKKGIIDYNYFTESIESFISNQDYPVIKNSYKNKIQKLLNHPHTINDKSNYYEVYYVENQNVGTSYKMYKDDIFVLDLFLGVLNLSTERGAQKFKDRLIKMHIKDDAMYSQSNFEYGYKLLKSSITSWQIIFE